MKIYAFNEYAMSPIQQFKEDLSNLPNHKIFKLAVVPKKGINNIGNNYKLISKSINTAIKMLNPNKNIGGHLFLLEIAMVESMLGTHPQTFRLGHKDRGPFQMNEVGFNETKNYKSHRSLLKYYKNLKHFGIDWLNTSVELCNTALFGAIAARMLILIDTKPIPKTLEERAEYWKSEYNTHLGKGTSEIYIERVKKCVNLLREDGIDLSRIYNASDREKIEDVYMHSKNTKHFG